MKRFVITTIFTIGLVVVLMFPTIFIIDYFSLSNAVAYAILFMVGSVQSDIRHWVTKK
jgi:hypothetical protein